MRVLKNYQKLYEFFKEFLLFEVGQCAKGTDTFLMGKILSYQHYESQKGKYANVRVYRRGGAPFQALRLMALGVIIARGILIRND